MSRTLKYGAIAATLMAISACGDTEPAVTGSAPDMRRLTQEQYANIVADLFGDHIVVGGQFDPLPRTDGLMAIGARTARVTPAGFEKFYELGRSVAIQVVSPENRHDLIPCVPAAVNAPDDTCASTFFSQVGRLLYRRALTDQERGTAVKAAHEAAVAASSFYDGIAEGLAGLMTTPQFLFVIDETEPDPARVGQVRLTGPAMASRMSFLLWNTTPDEVLMQAAEKGELRAKDGLTKQVDRLLASPRVETGARAFFADFFNFDKFEILEKDSVIYPSFSIRVAEDAREQLLKTAYDHLFVRGQDYRDLFITTKTFISPNLGRIYRVPVDRPDGGWMPYEFGPDEKYAGLLTQVGFVALHAHPGRSSPTLRGRALREVLMCQHVPDPPGNVDQTLFFDPKSLVKTARERLTAHATNATCAGCHKLTDPVGLGLEQFDGVGEFRTTENGAPIEIAGELDGVPYREAKELGQVVRNNPATASCLVNRVTTYALGRSFTREESPLAAYLEKAFAENDYSLPKLLRTIATGEALYTVAKSKESTS